MRILYIVPAYSPNSTGILKKQYDIINTFRASGCDVTGLFFSSSLNYEFSENNIYHFPVNTDKIRNMFSKKLIWRLLPYLLPKFFEKEIYKQVLRFIDNVDVVYIRNGSSDINTMPLYKLIKSRGKKIIFEYNAIYIYEEKVAVENNSSLFTKYKYYNELLLQKKTARYADVIVSVTKEIGDYYSKFNHKAKAFVLSNGVNPLRFPKRLAPKYDGKTIKFLFLSGGSTHYWHGIDRFLEGVMRYNGSMNIELTIAGPGFREFEKYKSKVPRIKFNLYDSIEGDDLDNVFNDAHIGIGSLGLHRKKLNEASVLKVREYIVRGLPFIIGYKDSDLFDQVSMTPYYMNVTADDSYIEFENVIKFANDVLTSEKHSENIRLIGTPLIDYQIKIARLIRILNEN